MVHTDADTDIEVQPPTVYTAPTRQAHRKAAAFEETLRLLGMSKKSAETTERGRRQTFYRKATPFPTERTKKARAETTDEVGRPEQSNRGMYIVAYPNGQALAVPD